MGGYAEFVIDSVDKAQREAEQDQREADALREEVYQLSGESLHRLAEEVLGADTMADLLIHRMAHWSADDIRASAKRAGVDL